MAKNILSCCIDPMQNNETLQHHLSTSQQMVHKVSEAILINNDYLQGIQPLSKAIHCWIKFIDMRQRVDLCPQDFKNQRNHGNLPVGDT